MIIGTIGIFIFTGLLVMGIVFIDESPLFLIGVLTSTFVILLIVIGFDDGSYEEGQIDALNGKIKYELEQQEDNTIQWVEIEEN